MTAQQHETPQTAPAFQAPTAEPAVVQIPAASNERLAQLQAQSPAATAAADAAAKRLKDITDAIKVEMTQAAPGAAKLELVGSGGPALRLSYVETWRLDSTKLKAEHPETYVRYAKKSGSWTLKALAGSAGE